MMPILQGVLVVTSLIFIILYIRTTLRFRQFRQHQLTEIAQTQEELISLQKKINFSASDPVTELLGWQLFEDRVTQGIKECARFQFILGVMYVDIDDFKLINNVLGYEVGDMLLKETALRLQSCIRQVDSISRQGKDTFVILLAQLAKQETAAIIIQRILQTMAQPLEINGNKLTVTVCVGAAFYPLDGLTTGVLMHNAEHAMLLAKERGKHTYQFYQEKLHANSQREMEIYNSLSSDTFLDELKITYQPIMNIQQKAMACADASIYWLHHALGKIDGEELFACADKHRKLNKITERVLRETCQQFLSWREKGLKPQLLGIPVFLKQLEHPQFIYRLSQIMQEMKMEPASLMLEIRESQVPVSLDILEKAFNMLHYMGVKIAIDRFGSGAFSLRYLKAIFVHYLKLDPGIIGDISQNEKTQAMVKSVAMFANNLGMEVIASGVDTDEQAAALQALGIELMQGKLYSEPLSEAEMAGKMTSV